MFCSKELLHQNCNLFLDLMPFKNCKREELFQSVLRPEPQHIPLPFSSTLDSKNRGNTPHGI